ncbi:MAG: CHAD domain-containing protein [Hyphomicrobium sp.]|jgi:hypothetical protein
MAYRFKLNEPTEKGFRRIGLEQIERAQAELEATAEPDTAIHEARKTMKRVRALLRLGRVGLGDDVFKEENARFREIALLLAPARDKHVLLQTVLKIEVSAGAVASAGLAAFKKVVQDDIAASKPGTGEGVSEAIERLRAAAKKFRRLKLDPDDFCVLQRGLEASYRTGRRLVAVAYATGHDEDFHEWRKSVQQHWRHMALLSRPWPEMLEARVNAAKELSQLLGDDHDLAQLALAAETCAPGRMADMHAQEIVRLVRQKQSELRQEALPRGQILFAEGARSHGRRMGEMWQAASDLASLQDAKQEHEPKQKKEAS